MARIAFVLSNELRAQFQICIFEQNGLSEGVTTKQQPYQNGICYKELQEIDLIHFAPDKIQVANVVASASLKAA
jgi:hypothetical protein